MKHGGLLLSFVMLPAIMAAQTLVYVGPFGVPTAVRGQSDNISTPIIVYENQDIAYLIPDITASGWQQWNLPLRDGKYVIEIYGWLKTDRERQQWLKPGYTNDPASIQRSKRLGFSYRLGLVDTRNSMVHWTEWLLLDRDGDIFQDTGRFIDEEVKLSSLSPELRAAINRTTAIVKQEERDFTGPSAQEAIHSDSEMVRRMAREAHTGSPCNSGGLCGCNATSEQLKNWHSTGCPPTEPTEPSKSKLETPTPPRQVNTPTETSKATIRTVTPPSQRQGPSDGSLSGAGENSDKLQLLYNPVTLSSARTGTKVLVSGVLVADLGGTLRIADADRKRVVRCVIGRGRAREKVPLLGTTVTITGVYKGLAADPRGLGIVDDCRLVP